MGNMLVHLDMLASSLEVADAVFKPYVCPVLHDKREGMMMLDHLID